MHRRQYGAALGSRSVLLTLCCAKWEPCRGLAAAGARIRSARRHPSATRSPEATRSRTESRRSPAAASVPDHNPPSLLTGGSCPAGCRAFRAARAAGEEASPQAVIRPCAGLPMPPAGRRLAARSRPRQGPSRGLFRPAERRALFLPLRGRNRCLERRKKQTG